MDAYQPISCALYDRYERAIITRTPLVIRWAQGDTFTQDHVTILALETVAGEEYLCFEDHNHHPFRVRLDVVRVIDWLTLL
ncbi:MAG: hypothetical protein ACYDEV_09840 [Acidiferrobacter sp.]